MHAINPRRTPKIILKKTGWNVGEPATQLHSADWSAHSRASLCLQYRSNVFVDLTTTSVSESPCTSCSEMKKPRSQDNPASYVIETWDGQSPLRYSAIRKSSNITRRGTAKILLANRLSGVQWSVGPHNNSSTARWMRTDHLSLGILSIHLCHFRKSSHFLIIFRQMLCGWSTMKKSPQPASTKSAKPGHAVHACRCRPPALPKPITGGDAVTSCSKQRWKGVTGGVPAVLACQSKNGWGETEVHLESGWRAGNSAPSQKADFKSWERPQRGRWTLARI